MLETGGIAQVRGTARHLRTPPRPRGRRHIGDALAGTQPSAS